MGRSLTAVLACPPTTSGERTRRMLALAAEAASCDSVTITNLFAEPAKDVPELARLAVDPQGWLSAREDLEAGVLGGHELIAGWGMYGFSGPAARHFREQLQWLRGTAVKAGHPRAWCVGGQPRHPSRWHQYVSDRHGRTGPGTTGERLHQVLVRAPWERLVPAQR